MKENCIKKSIEKIFTLISNLFPLRKYILLESVPDLSDNTKSVFDEMIKRKINDEYKLVWIVKEKSDLYPKYNNVEYINNKFLIIYYKFFSKALICCNGFLISRHKGQFSMYLTHGLPIKSTKDYYVMPKSIQYMLSPSKLVNNIMSTEFNVPINKIVNLGYPRNDVFTKEKKCNIIDIFKKNYKKIIVWYPTYRQSTVGIKHGKTVLPIIHDPEIATEINMIAEQEKILIILKPHFAQDISSITKLNLSNIKIIDDRFFVDNHISSYEFLHGCDALITDYSSVYYDYTLNNKPIAVIWEDIEEYKKNPGFAVDLDEYLKGAVKIYTSYDFCSFIKDVANDIDTLYVERNTVMKKVNQTDGKSAERVVDFIIKKIS